MSAWDGLLGALAAAPRLDGALCVGRSEQFDLAEPDTDPADVEHREQAALAFCQACRALPACSSWVDSLKPSQRPLGVVAGRVNRPPMRRRGAA